MRRELRRHPVQGQPSKTRTSRPARASASTGSGQRAPAASSGRSPMPSGGLKAFLRPQWARDVMSELKKVTWPTRQETTNLTVVVIVVAAVLGLFLGGLDFAFSWIIENTLLR